MVHRGHGVFDTALLVEGHLYQLDQHVGRLMSSAARACIPLPPGHSQDQILRTILETAAASKLADGACHAAAVWVMHTLLGAAAVCPWSSLPARVLG